MQYSFSVDDGNTMYIYEDGMLLATIDASNSDDLESLFYEVLYDLRGVE